MSHIQGMPKDQYLLLPPLVSEWIPENHPARIVEMFVDSLEVKELGFSEENEVRVVALPTVIDQELLELANARGVSLKPEKEKKVRKKRELLVPYIELFNSSDIELPIEKIIVGPHQEKEARASALRAELSKKKIEITCSDIPFVG